MRLFLSRAEEAEFMAFRDHHDAGRQLFEALRRRVHARAAGPSLGAASDSWWFCASEYLTDAAMVHAVDPSPAVARWLRETTLWLVRRPEADWIGPPFRDHLRQPPVGHLETAHLTWATAVVLDLASDVFRVAEGDELRAALQERGLPFCRRWLDTHDHLANWRCVLGAGVAVAAAVLGDKAAMERAVADYGLSLRVFQPDGSSAESLQYGNYAAGAMALAREALLRAGAATEDKLTARPWSKMPRWQAASLFYRKPLAGWGPAARARSANFNDSAALFRPSGDLLLHVAAREQRSEPTMAGLARWLFDSLYAPDWDQEPHDRASFGFLNDFGFLAVPLLPRAAAPLSPAAAGLDSVEAFSCGDVLVRDHWDGRTILAVRGGGDPLHGPGHLHGDLNSFLVVHNRERLLVDPGHSCYRNTIHDLETASRLHNTCTFLAPETEQPPAPAANQPRERLLEQSRVARSRFDRLTGLPGPLADRGARRLMACRAGNLAVVGSEAAALYGPPLRTFTRLWLLGGAHVLFIVDQIEATVPVRANWHWLLNQRDGGCEFEYLSARSVRVCRGGVALQLHCGAGDPAVPEYAFVHDAYEPFPAGRGEGRSGSGVLLTWREPMPRAARTVIHAIVMDDAAAMGHWTHRAAAGHQAWENSASGETWSLEAGTENAPDSTTPPLAITIRERKRAWLLRRSRSGVRLQSLA